MIIKEGSVFLVIKNIYCLKKFVFNKIGTIGVRSRNPMGFAIVEIK